MSPLVGVEFPRDPSLVGQGLGIDRTEGDLLRIASWVGWFFAILGCIYAVRVQSSSYAWLAGAGVAISIALSASARKVRLRLRLKRERALDIELEWSRNQRVKIDGYRSYITSLRPVFDIVIAVEGYEQQIVDELRGLDARIITTSEPHRVRVEIPQRRIDLHIEGSQPMEFPDLQLMKIVVARVETLLGDGPGIDRIEMGTHPSPG